MINARRSLDQYISKLMAFGGATKTSDFGLGQAGIESDMVHRNMRTDMSAEPINRVRARSVTN